MKAAGHRWTAWLLTLAVAVGFQATAQSANDPAATNATPIAPARVESVSHGSDESAFHIIPERNIFNANRSGGTVRGPSQRPARVETFTLVGTMAYGKGAFAFFEGSNSEFTKVLKADGIIAGHKLVDIYANSVKLEADGKEIELPLGSQMRREDEGTWHVAEAVGRSGGPTVASTRNGDSSSRDSSSRNNRSRGGDSRSRRDGESPRNRSENPADSGNRSSSNTSTSSADQAEVLKRLMERREKESQ